MGKKKIVTKGTDAAAGAAGSKVATAKRPSRSVEHGRMYVRVSYNNTIITVTDDQGNVIAWGTAGSLGFSGPKKATPFAAQKIIAAIAEKIAKTGPFNVDVVVSGMSVARDSAIRSLANHGFNILSIRDATPIPHNGPKPRKVRRV
ncbi:MAG: 30S ribosomal protein S11 [Candidatus Colwellbacteria bacterium]|nr:30S ribosomal protein S11 [Candidatus Colwellbacteria bacterium]